MEGAAGVVHHWTSEQQMGHKGALKQNRRSTGTPTIRPTSGQINGNLSTTPLGTSSGDHHVPVATTMEGQGPHVRRGPKAKVSKHK